MITAEQLEMKEILKEQFTSFNHLLVEDIASESHFMHVPAGDVIMDIGWYIKQVPLLYKGHVKVFREDEDGNELFLYYLYPGDACAISLVCSGHEKISKIRAVALEDSEFIAFPIKFMDDWMLKHKDWYYFVLDTYSFRFEEVLKTVDDIAFHKMDERLVRYLKKAMNAHDSNEIPLSHQDIAYELNSSREVISRLLKKLEQRGKIVLHRGQIEILDL
jgi:CRP/FNR family transcriptional regulator, anaerobic regulatory protein